MRGDMNEGHRALRALVDGAHFARVRDCACGIELSISVVQEACACTRMVVPCRIFLRVEIKWTDRIVWDVHA